MNAVSRVQAACAVAFGLSLASVHPTAAHRLDEYLQAIRLDVEMDRLHLTVNLTPGADIAHAVLDALDRNGDGHVATSEADAYAASVLEDISVTLDGDPLRLTPVAQEFPTTSDIAAGVGVIRLQTTARIAAAEKGAHRLRLVNDYRPDIGVYLVNALAPGSARVRIVRQERDALQRTLTLDYEISRTPLASGWLLLGTLAALTLAGWRRRVNRGRPIIEAERT